MRSDIFCPSSQITKRTSVGMTRALAASSVLHRRNTRLQSLVIVTLRPGSTSPLRHHLRFLSATLEIMLWTYRVEHSAVDSW
jgi:hypothetical protein